MMAEKDRKGDLGELKPSATESAPALPHRSGVLPNAVDITGQVSDDVRIDPYITEGHPGYEESGESQIIPMDRLTQQEGKT